MKFSYCLASNILCRIFLDLYGITIMLNQNCLVYPRFLLEIYNFVSQYLNRKSFY